MSISIISVNWNGYDFQSLMIDSILKHSKEEHPILIFNNNLDRSNDERIREWSVCGKNMGHGYGINFLLQEVQTKYVLLLDIDCHLLTNWEEEFLKYKDFIVAPAGPPQKPLRVACLFAETDKIRHYDFMSTPGYKGHRVTPDGFDVGIAAYHQMAKDGLEFKWMDTTPGRYGPERSEEYGLDKKPLVYHYWHGTHLNESDRQKDFEHDLVNEKEIFFNVYAKEVAN